MIDRLIQAIESFGEVSIMQIESKNPNDCAIVALSAYFGIPYDDVLAELKDLAIKFPMVWNFHKGTPTVLHNAFCFKRGLKPIPVPRRGQDKITGIVSLHAANAKNGHLVACIDGIIFDAFVPEGMPIAEYRQKFTTSHVRDIWR